MSEKISQQLFLKVKEKLDYYRLPTIFPVQATSLLHKLICLMEDNDPKHSLIDIDSKGEGLSSALRHQMSRILKESNKLHMDIMVARQQNQSLQHRLYKLEANRNSQSRQYDKYSQLKSKREQELIEQLREVKYKYNQLMDFIHEDPTAEREYIKRLMKHKHLNNKNIEEYGVQNPRQLKIEQTRQGGYNQNIRQLEIKVKNREAEILRLQNLLQYDGSSMNKIIKNFQDNLVKNRLKDADHKINFLEQSVSKIKKQNTNMKNKNGQKQALRLQVQKCHKIINNLKKQNEELKRNYNQQNFDIQKQNSEKERKMTQIKHQKAQINKISEQKSSQINNLQKKNDFLHKQIQQLRYDLEKSKKTVKQKQNILHEKQKKIEQIKLYYEAQIENYNKKIHQLQFEIRQLKVTGKNLIEQHEINRKQNQIKSQSILNLQKIVNQLLRKNSDLADNAAGSMEQAIRLTNDNQTKRQVLDLQQQLSQCHIRLSELQEVQRALLIENEKLRSLARRS